MELTDEKFIPAPIAEVYAALNDRDILARCIPGCESLAQKSDSELAAKVTLKVGPIKATFNGEVTLSDQNPPHGYTISGQGSGGAAGAAKGSAVVTLRKQAGGTLLAYKVDARMSGKIAQLGARLIDATAKKLAAQFFEKFAECLSPPESAADSLADSPAATGNAASASNAASATNRKWLIAAAVIIVIIAIALTST